MFFHPDSRFLIIYERKVPLHLFVASLMLPLCLCKHLAPSGVCTALPCAPGSKNKISICVRGAGVHTHFRYETQFQMSH